MSFRTRLVSFFVVIVVLPMIAVGVLAYRLIDDSVAGKVAARADGLATAVASLYEREMALARADARSIVRDPALFDRPMLVANLQAIALPGFGPSPVGVTVLSSLGAAAGSVTSNGVLPATFIVAFLMLAFSFSLLASRALQGQLGWFLHAARRLAKGDFSSPIRTEGRDEFARSARSSTTCRASLRVG